MAEGRGFEPPRDSRPYPISSRTPSTGLGHPSAPMLSMTYRVSHLSASSRVAAESKSGPGSTAAGALTPGTATTVSTLRPSGPETDARGAEPRAGTGPAPLLDRSQVYTKREAKVCRSVCQVRPRGGTLVILIGSAPRTL